MLEKNNFIIAKCKFGSTRLITFLSENIGIVDSIIFKMDTYKHYVNVEYDNVPNDLNGDFYDKNKITLILSEIAHHSNNKEDLQYILNVNKYNL